MTEDLKDVIYSTIRRCLKKSERIGIAFSGGVDSSLLSKVCKDLGLNVTLITVGTEDSKDISHAKGVSERLGLNLITKILTTQEIKSSAKEVMSTLKTKGLLDIELGIAFFHVCNLASKNKIEIVITADGIDELFCGYDKYRRIYGKGSNTMETEIKNYLNEMGKRIEKFERMAKLFGLKFLHPFTSKEFVKFSLKIPLDLKIKGHYDKLRKLILREVALKVGIPEYVSMRPKKAAQYSSGIHKAITKLAKKEGLRRREFLNELMSK